MPKNPAPARELTDLQAWALLCLAVAAVYANSLPGKLVGFDDKELLLPMLGGPQGGAQTGGLFVGRSLRLLSHRLDALVFGWNLAGHHAVNVLWHAAASCAAFVAARAVLPAAGALAAALLFALHPLQTESVAYLAGRRDVMVGAFYLGAFALWTRSAGPRGRAGAATLWMLAMLCKPTAVTLPAAVLLYEWLRGRADGILRRPAFWLLAGAAAAAAAGYARFEMTEAVSQSAAHHADPYWYGSPGEHWATLAGLFWRVGGLVFFPWGLTVDYTYPAAWTPPAGTAVALGLAAAGALALAWKASGQPAWRLGLGWLVLAYLPHLPVVPSVHNKELFAEHWLYVPLFGAGLAFGAAASRVPPAAWATALLLLAGRTAARNLDWRDDLSLWTSTVKVAPAAARARSNLGVALLRRDRPEEAQRQFELATSLGPRWVLPRLNLGLSLERQGKADEALAQYRRAMELEPENAQAALLWLDLSARLGRHVADYCRRRPRTAATAEACARIMLTHGNYLIAEYMLRTGYQYAKSPEETAKLEATLGRVQLETGRNSQAEESLRRSLAKVEEASNRVNLAVAQARQGKIERALEQGAILRQGGDERMALLAEGMSYRAAGKLSEALAVLEKRAALEPDADVQLQLAQVRLTLGKSAEADMAFLEAAKLRGLPGDYAVWVRSLMDRGARAEAKELLEAALRKYPRNRALRTLELRLKSS